jgi:glycerol-3-phosphate acyltransferase PlsX
MVAMRMLEERARPALASFLPTTRGETVMLDLGANLDADADNLAEFAVMGSVFAQVLLGPRGAQGRAAERGIGGAERPRGAAPAAGGCAGPRPPSISTVLEGNDIGAGRGRRRVTDGFTGNVR